MKDGKMGELRLFRAKPLTHIGLGLAIFDRKTVFTKLLRAFLHDILSRLINGWFSFESAH